MVSTRDIDPDESVAAPVIRYQQQDNVHSRAAFLAKFISIIKLHYSYTSTHTKPSYHIPNQCSQQHVSQSQRSLHNVLSTREPTVNIRICLSLANYGNMHSDLVKTSLKLGHGLTIATSYTK